jgi:WD40 repeat protein
VIHCQHFVLSIASVRTTMIIQPLNPDMSLWLVGMPPFNSGMCHVWKIPTLESFSYAQPDPWLIMIGLWACPPMLHHYTCMGDKETIICSCCFDEACRLWSTRDWMVLHTLQGHEGKVISVDFITYPTTSNAANTPFSIVTCGFDKTLKIWT